MGGGHRTIRSSKQSTYDPRKAKELKKQKTFTIKKRYQKLKKKLNDVKVRECSTVKAWAHRQYIYVYACMCDADH